MPERRRLTPWRSDAPSDFGVGNRFAGAKVLQRQPDTPLERGPAQIERKVQADLRSFDEGHDPRYQGLVLAIGPDEPRVREAILEAADQRLRIVAEQDRGHTLLAGGHQRAPSDVWPTANLSSSSRPPARNLVGVMPSMPVAFS